VGLCVNPAIHKPPLVYTEEDISIHKADNAFSCLHFTRNLSTGGIFLGRWPALGEGGDGDPCGGLLHNDMDLSLGLLVPSFPLAPALPVPLSAPLPPVSPVRSLCPPMPPPII
jgi:hypothetical protein